ncbi:transcriptional regulator, CdaR family [Micromonospora pattaloongensis]|uniref:Transcriptional regulator, CdaR family n=1 Tax=Micromonospora pattaloongensis TaxID=405436 RepID=A0A1H3S5A4_9ACTN|nr:helix-turn-helix domain-containing protein [Micromonospora pattaloongensis]SDZ33122.1 transcriptional regulator, CdaR family [Micromonospora pattaloongensis]
MSDVSAPVEFLELLAREAAAVEFEGPLVAARAAGASPERLGELESAKLVALRVRALLERRRRREVELSGLYDTASDLAGLRDVDAVLRAIVHRARHLLGTDVAYMTLNDEARGDTYMRVTDGSISGRFQRLRLPMGAGLGGLVAQTGTPYATANYPEDLRFRHTGEIDAGVTEEGLVAILGVPLRLGSTVIGVLFAANRSARPFAPEEVALLVSLAAHAAVALDTARLLAETRAALAELSAANGTIQAHSASVERAAAAHDRMTSLVLRGGGVEDVAAAVTEVLGGALLALDADGRRLARVGEIDEPDRSAMVEAVAASRAEGHSVRRGSLWYAAVVAGAENLGALVLRPTHELVDADQRILERAALVTALLLLFRRTVAEAEGRVRGELLDDLIARPVRDVEALRGRARRLGVDLDAPHVLVAVGDDAGSGTGAARQRVASWATTYAGTRGGLAAARDGRVVLMLPGRDAGGAARAVARDLGRLLGRPVTAGAAGPSSGPASLAEAFREADRCLTALAALGRQGQGASSAELGFVGLLLGAVGEAGDRDVARFLDETVGAVVDYDARRGTALVKTLETYFGVGGSLARAAELLHVHVNTVTQRLDRVGQLIGPDWQRPERALEVQLALRLHRLRTPTTG